MKESLSETLIPCLVIKTSWHKLSKVLGHGEVLFYLQGSKKCSDWLSLSRKTHTPGRTHIDYLSKFLSAASSRPGCSDASTSTLSSIICCEEPIQHGENLLPSTDDWRGSSKMGTSHITNRKSKQRIVGKMNGYSLKCGLYSFPALALSRLPHVDAISSLFMGFSYFSTGHIRSRPVNVDWDNLSFN